MKFAKFFWIAALLLIAIPVASAADPENADFFVSPWRLGMTRDQVIAEKEFGPYKPVQVTGGVETFDAQFDGRKTNVSFVFDDADTLSYIQVWKYEGPDFEPAKQAALDVYDLFSTRFGGLTIPGIEQNGSSALDRKGFEAMLVSFVGRAPEVLGKEGEKEHIAATLTLDLIPNSQPPNCRLHSQIIYSTRFKTFLVFLFQDRVGAPSRTVPANIKLEKL